MPAVAATPLVLGNFVVLHCHSSFIPSIDLVVSMIETEQPSGSAVLIPNVEPQRAPASNRLSLVARYPDSDRKLAAEVPR